MNIDPYTNIRKLTRLPTHMMKSYALLQPLATHYREATCAEVECRGFREDMTVTFDLTVPQQVSDANWLRNHSGLRFTYFMLDDDRKVKFVVPAGQRCLESLLRPHRVPLEREPLMVVRGGDTFRGNPTGERRSHTSPESFVDEWATDLDKLKTVQERG